MNFMTQVDNTKTIDPLTDEDGYVSLSDGTVEMLDVNGEIALKTSKTTARAQEDALGFINTEEEYIFYLELMKKRDKAQAELDQLVIENGIMKEAEA